MNAKKSKRSTVFSYLVVGASLALFYGLFIIYPWNYKYKLKKDNSSDSNTQYNSPKILKYNPPAGVWPLISGRLSQTNINTGDELTVTIIIKNTAVQSGVLPIVVSQRPEKVFRFTVSVLENGKPTQSLPQIKDDSLIAGYDSRRIASF